MPSNLYFCQKNISKPLNSSLDTKIFCLLLRSGFKFMAEKFMNFKEFPCIGILRAVGLTHNPRKHPRNSKNQGHFYPPDTKIFCLLLRSGFKFMAEKFMNFKEFPCIGILRAVGLTHNPRKHPRNSKNQGH